MAKFKLQAGMDLDLFTQKEMDDSLKRFSRDWMVEAAKGPRHVRWSARGTIAAGILRIGGNDATVDSGRLGPEAGMVWSVKRWNVQGLNVADTLHAYVNSDSPWNSIIDGITGYNRFGSDELVIMGNDRLLFTGTALVATGDIFVSGSAWELPATLMYRLL